jgi:hypothetical protein
MEHLSTVKEELDHEQITNETLAIVKVSLPECIQVESVYQCFSLICVFVQAILINFSFVFHRRDYRDHLFSIEMRTLLAHSQDHR